MRDGKDTYVVRFDGHAVCHDCGAEVSGSAQAQRWARKHAVETGHSPTVNISYDVHKKEER